MPALEYRRFLPHPKLRPIVQCYWTTSAALPGQHGVIPAGHADLLFNLGGRVIDDETGDVFVDGPGGFVAGPCDRFRRFRTERRFEFVGVRFQLGTASILSGLPLNDTRNRAVRIENLVRGRKLVELRALECRLADAAGTCERITRLDRCLLRHMRRSSDPDAAVLYSVRLIRQSAGRISVRQMASALRIGERQLERKFARHVGLSPKLLSIVTRFQHVKALVDTIRGPAGADLAHACGYSDQAHLIREFRQFTGYSPGRYSRIPHVGFFLYHRSAEG